MSDDRAPVLPELVRSLRMLGIDHDPCTKSAHDAVFGPLLDARARAGAHSVEKALAAFKGASLIARIEALAATAATSGITNAATARSRTAHAEDALRELRNAAEQLDAEAVHARDGGDEWDAWLAQLRRFFATADHACEALARVFAMPVASDPARSWFRRAGS